MGLWLALMFFGGGGVVLAVWGFIVGVARRDRQEQWIIALFEEVGEDYGGRVLVPQDPFKSHNPELHFETDDLQVRVMLTVGPQADSLDRFTEVYVNHSLDLPAVTLIPPSVLGKYGHVVGRHDIDVGIPEIDARYVVSGNEEALTRVLLQDQAARLLGLHRAAKQQGLVVEAKGKPAPQTQITTFEFSKGTAHIVLSDWLVDPNELSGVIADSMALIRGLNDAMWSEWQACLGGDVQRVGDGYVIEGVVDGVTVTGGHRRIDGIQCTVISAEVVTAKGLHAAHIDEAKGLDHDRVELNNPVAAMTISASAVDVAKARQILSDQAVIESLLPVLHAFPGSVLCEDRLSLIIPHRVASGVDDLVSRVVKAVVAIRGVCADGGCSDADREVRARLWQAKSAGLWTKQS